MKRYLYLVHRWLGVALCLFMAMWFFSGVVMMYVGYPKLTPGERLSALPALDPARCCVDLSTALAAAGESESPQSVRLTTIGRRADLCASSWRGRAGAPARSVAVRASDGGRIAERLSEEALATARAFLGVDGALRRRRRRGPMDAFQSARRSASAASRLYVTIPIRRLLYVSSVTGEVVRDATRVERIWNWVGAWIHWLYPFRGGWLDAYWHDIVVYSSLVGTVLAITGLAVGVMRWRFRAPYKTGARTPYREGMMKWHHLVGLLGGATAITFVFSGLMSMNPWKIFETNSAFDTKAYYGGAIAPERFGLAVDSALAEFSAAGSRRARSSCASSTASAIMSPSAPAERRASCVRPRMTEPLAMLPLDELQRLGARLVPGAQARRSDGDAGLRLLLFRARAAHHAWRCRQAPAGAAPRLRRSGGDLGAYRPLHRRGARQARLRPPHEPLAVRFSAQLGRAGLARRAAALGRVHADAQWRSASRSASRAS